MNAGASIDYLAPSNPGFWEWDGEAIVFANGSTLAFRQELMGVLGRLKPYGLPPLDAVLLFLSATRDPWLAPGGGLEAFRQSLTGIVEIPESEMVRQWRDTLEHNLLRLHQLGTEWRESLSLKAFLAEILFEDSPERLDPSHSEKVIDLLARGFYPPDPQARLSPNDAFRRLLMGLKPLLTFNGSLDPEHLRWRLKTGLDFPVADPKETKPLTLQVRSMLAQLEGDPEFAGLARLTKNLMAAVHVPRALSDPEELPLGGFSDITNRGTLDRLLVSELAHDDLVLSVRLALNEALYLRRESPPKTPQNARLLLIDNGLRLWGTPRLFAMSVALAIAATTQKETQVRAYVPTSKQHLQAVSLHSKAGLMEALSPLHPHAHPGNALLELAQRLESTEQNDVILITHRDVLDDEAFQSILALLPRLLYIAAIDRDGTYRLCQVHRGHIRVLTEATLSLAELLAPNQNTLVRSDIPSSLPAIFHQQDFPMRMPPLNEGFLQGRHGKEILQLTPDRRLLAFDDPNKGGRQIHGRLDKGKPFPITVQNGQPGTAYAALRNGRSLRLIRFGRQINLTKIQATRPINHAILVHHQVLLVHHRHLSLFDAATGQALAEHTLDGAVTEVKGAYVKIGQRWFRLSVDGHRPLLERAGEAPVDTDPALPFIPTTRTVRHLKGIGFAEGNVILRAGGFHYAVAIHQEALIARRWDGNVSIVPFQAPKSPLPSHEHLCQAVFPGGLRVHQDRSGLTHFQPPDHEVPQLTLAVTSTNALSVWTANNETYGDPYFFAQASTTPAINIHRHFQHMADRVMLAESSS